jgi:3-hydroxybutyrate dehydrogenase
MLAEVAAGIAAAEGRTEKDVRAAMVRTGAARRLIRPDEVAAVCLALCGPGFGAVTGTTVRVDAGYLLMG